VKYSNYFGLDLARIEEVLGKEYISMLEASGSKEVQNYSYTIAHHNFQEHDMNSDYWKGMLGKKGRKLHNIGIRDLRVPINKKRFEDELHRLLEVES